MFKRTMGLNILGMSYNTLLSLEMMMGIKILKCDGQCSNLIHVMILDPWSWIKEQLLY